MIFHPIESLTQLDVGSVAPKFDIEEVVNKENTKIESFEDHIIVLDFWAIWCTPCVESIPDLNNLYEEFKSKNVQFISISDDPLRKLQNFLEFKEVNYPVVVDEDGSEFRKFNVNSRPRNYILNRKGIVVYSGNSINRDLIEMAIKSETIKINKDDQKTPIVKEHNLKIITNGGFSPGDDPIVTGMKIMLGERDVTGMKKISQFIIRPSLEKAFSGRGFRTTKEFVGVTYSGGRISEILQFICELPSLQRIEDNSSDTIRYDIIYWKKSKSLKLAFDEIQQELLEGLNLVLDPVEKKQSVNLLTLNTELNSPLPLKKENIPKGAETVFVDVVKFSNRMEEASGELYILDENLHNRFIPGDEMSNYNLLTANKEEIENHLAKYGIVIRKEEKTITTYKLMSSNIE